VESRAGAAGNLATAAVAKAAPDGYTLLMIHSTSTINTTLYDNLDFDFVADIAPIATLFRDAMMVVVVNPSFPAKSLPEFISYAMLNPGKVNMGSSGVGTANHVYGELFKLSAGVDLVHVPYRGQPQVLTDLLGGHIDVTFDPVTNSLGYIGTGRLRTVAVTGATRLPILADIPTVGEFVPGYEASLWLGLAPQKAHLTGSLRC
jgi:tripartite-type tricarboxylate transporter receptor subunit TctC